jgi:hypothetical protein
MLTELREIGGQLDRLLELCQRLSEENRSRASARNNCRPNAQT